MSSWLSHKMTEYPCVRVPTMTWCAMPAKNGLEMSGTTKPMVRVFLRRKPRASWLGTKLDSLASLRTAASVCLLMR